MYLFRNIVLHQPIAGHGISIVMVQTKKTLIIAPNVPVVLYLALAVRYALLQEILIPQFVLKWHADKHFQLRVALRLYGVLAAVHLICIFITLGIIL